MLPDRRHHDTTDYAAQVKHLEAKIHRLSISLWFGVLTRQGLDEALADLDVTGLYLVFFDIDRLKQANDRYGKVKSSAYIKASIQPRANDILGEKERIIGQWFSGDEFVGIFTESEVLGYAQRVQRTLHQYQMSATFIILPATHRVNVLRTIDYADAVCQMLKARGVRNRIVRL